MIGVFGWAQRWTGANNESIMGSRDGRFKGFIFRSFDCEGACLFHRNKKGTFEWGQQIALVFGAEAALQQQKQQQGSTHFTEIRTVRNHRIAGITGSSSVTTMR